MFFIRVIVLRVFVCCELEYIFVMMFLVVGVELELNGKRKVVVVMVSKLYSVKGNVDYLLR